MSSSLNESTLKYEKGVCSYCRISIVYLPERYFFLKKHNFKIRIIIFLIN